jgi:glutathione peroxidase-family protein
MPSDGSTEPKWAFEKYLNYEVGKITKFFEWMEKPSTAEISFDKRS